MPRSASFRSTAILLLFLGCFVIPVSAGQSEGPSMNDHGLNGRIQVGYAVVTPGTGPAAGMVVFETFGENRGFETTQAAVLPSEMTTHAIMFVNASGRLSRNLGVAMANPGIKEANVTMTLRDEEGNTLATETVVLKAHYQSSRFVTELFADHPSVPRDLTGTVEIVSDVPVAMTGLRFRGVNFSTLPVKTLVEPVAVPVIDEGIGGPSAVILAHFAAGGGWATEIVIANTGNADLTVRVDLFTRDGLPLVATLNGQSKSSFTGITIPKFGVVTLAPRNYRGDSDF